MESDDRRHSRRLFVTSMAAGASRLQVPAANRPRSCPQDTPMGRAGQPAELASIHVLLATDEATYSSGQVFAAVGGRGGP